MSLYPEHYNSPGVKKLTSAGHLGPCLEMVRQTIQCASDVTPLPFRIGPNEFGPLGNYRGDVLHVCRDFEKVKEWAYSRAASEGLRLVLNMKPEEYVGTTQSSI
jgi:hypothetical protein